MRDFLAATRDRVVVFDGGMGATLEQFDLSLEEGLQAPRPLPRGADPQPAGRHRGRAHVDGRGGRGGRGDRHVPGVAAQARGVGARRAHVRDQRQGGADRAQGRRRGPLRGRLDRPDRASCPRPRSRASGRSASASSSRSSRSSPRVCSQGGVDLLIVETAQDILEVKAAIFGMREAFKTVGRRVPIQASVSLLPNGGKMLLGTDISAALDDAGGAEGRRHRPQLLHRPRGHARRDPLPRRVLAGADPLHPERRHPASGPGRRDDLPRAARPAGRGARRLRRALRRRHRRRLLRHHAGAHPRRSRSAAARTRSPRARPRARRTSPR